MLRPVLRIHSRRVDEARLRRTHMWNLPAPPGFVGFDDQRPVRIYMRHLPHWRQEGVTYFATFRLGDSLPQSRLRELKALRALWERQNPEPRTEEQWQQITRSTMERVEQWLDEGHGCCVLREEFAAECLEQKLRHYDGQQYDLCAYVIMPNHVHVLVAPYSDADHPLERIEQAWKSFSSREINRQRQAKGSLWQLESFDRIVRDEEHLWRCIQYIGSNPSRAGLSLDSVRRWIRPHWVAAGWNFDT